MAACVRSVLVMFVCVIKSVVIWLHVLVVCLLFVHV